MLDYLWQWILYLNEPIHVANIQRYFGLERKDLPKDSAQSALRKGHSTPKKVLYNWHTHIVGTEF